MVRITPALSTLLLLAGCQLLAPAPDYERWALLENPFESTTGGGVMIDGYDPVLGESGWPPGLHDRLFGSGAQPAGALQRDRLRREAGARRHPLHERQVAGEGR